MKLEKDRELVSFEALFSISKSYSIAIKLNSSHCRHQGVRNQNKCTLENHKDCLANKENKYGGKYCFGCPKNDISVVKQKDTFKCIWW